MILPFLKKHCKVLAAIAGESSAQAGPAHLSHAAAHTTAAMQWQRSRRKGTAAVLLCKNTPHQTPC